MSFAHFSEENEKNRRTGAVLCRLRPGERSARSSRRAVVYILFDRQTKTLEQWNGIFLKFFLFFFPIRCHGKPTDRDLEKFPVFNLAPKSSLYDHRDLNNIESTEIHFSRSVTR